MSMRFPALLPFALFALMFHGAANGAAAARAASPYPERPVRVIVPFPPGRTDRIARLLAAKLGETLKQTVIVDNRPGAAGTRGASIAARSQADGYTMLLTTATFPASAAVLGNLPYDAVKDFDAVASVGSVPFVLVVNPAIPAKTLQQFITLAKAKPGELNYSSPGTGSLGHLATLQFARQAGIRVKHSAYKGTGAALQGLLAAKADFMVTDLARGLQPVRAGELRALGVAAARRSPLAPELPTMVEGGVPGFEAGTWFGVLAPHGTPKHVVELLNREINRLLGTQPLRDELAAQGVLPTVTSPAGLAGRIRSELKKWSALVRKEHLPRF